MSKLWIKFKNSFTTHPYIANCLVYGTLFVAAQFSQQMVTKKILSKPRQSLDWESIKNYALFGTFGQGPFLTTWYRWLDVAYPGAGARLVIKKVLMDQCLMTSWLLIYFYSVMSVLEGKNTAEQIQTKMIPTFKSSCMFWFPVQIINFVIIPSTFRVVYVGICSFAWVNILCYIHRQDHGHDSNSLKDM